MRLFGCFLTLSALSLSSFGIEGFAEINENFHHLNDELLSISKIYHDGLESYFKNLTIAIEKIPKLSHHIEDMKALFDSFEAIKFPLYDDIKTWDDLKLRNATNFLSFKHFSFTDQDEGRAFTRVVEIYNAVHKSYKKNREFVDEKVKNFVEILDEIDELYPLARNFSDFLFILLAPFNTDLQKLMNEKLKTCNCPRDFSSSDLLNASSDYSRAFKSSYESEISVCSLVDSLQTKINETTLKLNQSDLLQSTNSCLFGISYFYYLNTLYQENNTCLNLEIDLVNQELLVWRSPKVVEELRMQMIPCLEKADKELEESLKDLQEDDKKMIREIMEIVQNLIEICSDHVKVLEQSAEKIHKIHKELKRVRNENCSCGK